MSAQDRERDREFVLLTTDADGVVWIQEGRSPAAPVRAADHHVLCDVVRQRRARFGVPGLARNAPLLLRLYDASLHHDARCTVAVCSPAVCPSDVERDDPVFLLYCARDFAGRAASVGGWRPFGPLDAAAFAAAERAHTGQPESATSSPYPPDRHPARPALALIPDLDLALVDCLLGTIVDPRWFVDPWAPATAPKRLAQFLGLAPRVLAVGAASGPGGAAPGHLAYGGRAWRCRLSVLCWRRGAQTPPPLEGLRPEQFLWRRWHEKGGGAAGDLAATKLFVEYLRQTWLRAVCRGGRASEVFVPELFFGADAHGRAAASACCRHLAG